MNFTRALNLLSDAALALRLPGLYSAESHVQMRRSAE